MNCMERRNGQHLVDTSPHRADREGRKSRTHCPSSVCAVGSIQVLHRDKAVEGYGDVPHRSAGEGGESAHGGVGDEKAGDVKGHCAERVSRRCDKLPGC